MQYFSNDCGIATQWEIEIVALPALPTFNSEGDLPVGVYGATRSSVLEHFGQGTIQRRVVADRLNRIYQLVASTGQLARFIVFGSFITAKAEPDDVDIFLLHGGYLRLGIGGR